MEYKDYYKTLGIECGASSAEIKRAYRKLAMQYHPDRNPGDKRSEELFKEINEAYQVLSDPEKRTRYDQLGESYNRWQQGGSQPGGFNWDEWLSSTPGGGGGQRVEVGNLEDLFGGNFSEFFTRIFGGMAGMPGMPDLGNFQPSGGVGRRMARPSMDYSVTISLQEAYHGATRRLDVNGRRLEVKLPAGANSGTKIRVPDAILDTDGHRGDLFLIVQVSEDPRFQRKGDDLHTDVAVDLYTAVLGGEVSAPTLAGNVVLTIPAGTQPEQVFRLAGRGMPRLKDPKVHGDLFARVKVKLPRNLTAEQQQLFRQLAGR
jgi:curved DNA-binding protein